MRERVLHNGANSGCVSCEAVQKNEWPIGPACTLCHTASAGMALLMEETPRGLAGLGGSGLQADLGTLKLRDAA